MLASNFASPWMVLACDLRAEGVNLIGPDDFVVDLIADFIGADFVSETWLLPLLDPTEAPLVPETMTSIIKAMCNVDKAIFDRFFVTISKLF